MRPDVSRSPFRHRTGLSVPDPQRHSAHSPDGLRFPHWRGDALSLLPEDMATFCYTYLLLRAGSDVKEVEEKISGVVSGMSPENAAPLRARLMPLTDIHLHSHNLRELGVNGSLIFSYNRRFYQLLRLHGAPGSVIFRDEALQALVLVLCSAVAGLLLAALVFGYGLVSGSLELGTTVLR